jgi:hypothetical protein
MEIFIGVVFTKYNMLTNAVIVTVDVHVTHTGEPPVYRLYVGNELFAERTWIWSDVYLCERIILEAPYGFYPIKCELLPHADATIEMKSPKVELGPARFRKNFGLEVHDESS